MVYLTKNGLEDTCWGKNNVCLRDHNTKIHKKHSTRNLYIEIGKIKLPTEITPNGPLPAEYIFRYNIYGEFRLEVDSNNNDIKSLIRDLSLINYSTSREELDDMFNMTMSITDRIFDMLISSFEDMKEKDMAIRITKTNKRPL